MAWPWLAKAGKQMIRYVALLCIPVSLIICFFAVPNEWYNPVCHFVFFATGALVALMFHERPWNLGLVGRTLIGAAGALAPIVQSFFYAHLGRWTAPITFLVVDVGVILVFLSIFQLSSDLIPKWIIYLGQISYGLYVFHLACLKFVTRAIIPGSSVAGSQFLSLLSALILSLTLTIAIAGVSYRYFETPFLRLKQRFEFIRSRSVSA